ncbi:MAG TPA: VOC family protein [Candidatus Binatia bacterium]|jgi:hypothetical protein
MRIRQIALVARDLDPVLADLRAVLGLGEPFADPGVGVFGLRNGVFPLGEHFLEVVSPKQEGTSAGRFLARRGDGGYMVIFQTRDLAGAKARLGERGVRTVWEVALEDIETAHLHPRDTGGAIVSMDEARPFESWRWAGPGWREQVRTDRVAGIAGVEIQSEEPDRLAAHWQELFGLGTPRRPATFVLPDGGFVRFVEDTDGRGEGIHSIVLETSHAQAIRTQAAARGLAIDADGAIVIAGVRMVTGQS